MRCNAINKTKKNNLLHFSLKVDYVRTTLTELIACLHDQNKSCVFGVLAFFQPIRVFEKFSDCFD